MLSMRQRSAGLVIHRRQIRLRSAYFHRYLVGSTTNDWRATENPFPPSRLFALRLHESDRLLDFSTCMKSMAGMLVTPRACSARDKRTTSLQPIPDQQSTRAQFSVSHRPSPIQDNHR
jgi:hypothetical protein